MRTICGRVSATISRVSSGSSMPKPFCSVVEEPRPVPNSKRPSERWSSMATRSAMRAGWFTGGVMLKMPEPMWMLLVLAAQKARKDSEADRCEYSVRKWCSEAQVYLKPALSAATMKATSSMMRSCSADAPCCSTYRGSRHAALKMPNSMGLHVLVYGAAVRSAGAPATVTRA